MGNAVIEIDNLWKEYRLGVINHGTLSRDLQSWWSRVRGKEDPNSRIGAPGAAGPGARFWALRQISLQVKQGEVLGIIGRNGAGKSTLLKVLSQVTAPTRGEVRYKGRIASLLEVGTGFHPELTGRENIFLNGAILGMTKADIRGRLDEIVAFAEIEQFLDTPVKRYSSGMYVRLAFAVAAHLEPEILVVDEVLAVGDAQFQKKCLGKMEEVSAREGRTVLFVSHSMPTITSLCRRAILLDSGEIVNSGDTSEVVLAYYSSGLASPASFVCSESLAGGGDAHAALVSGAVLNSAGEVAPEVDIREPFSIRMRYRVKGNDGRRYFPNFHFYYSDGVRVLISSPRGVEPAGTGVYESECFVPANFLNEGTYFVGLALTSFHPGMQCHFYQPNTLSFNVKDPIDDVPTRHPGFSAPIPGVVRPLFNWSTRSVA